MRYWGQSLRIAAQAAAVIGFLLTQQSGASVDSGMVLFRVGTESKGSLKLLYLSTGERIVIVEGQVVKDARFSPDGTRIVAIKDIPGGRAKVGHTMDLDGSNLTSLGFSTNYAAWCTNGYICFQKRRDEAHAHAGGRRNAGTCVG